MPIRFQNLPLLLNSMNQLGWVIDAFRFGYNNVQTIVILRLYADNEHKPNIYAQAKLEFIDVNDVNHSIEAYCDFYEVHFHNTHQFCHFFNIQPENGGHWRDIFVQFAELFSDVIPQEKIIQRNNVLENQLMVRRLEPNNPNAIYCYDVRRNGHRENGLLNVRSLENSNKAELLRPILYTHFRADTNLSFFFSEDPNDEMNDMEIIERFANRNR